MLTKKGRECVYLKFTGSMTKAGEMCTHPFYSTLKRWSHTILTLFLSLIRLKHIPKKQFKSAFQFKDLFDLVLVLISEKIKWSTNLTRRMIK